MIRNGHCELSGQRRITGILYKFRRHSSDEEAVLVETEDCHLLHTESVRIDALCLHGSHIRHLSRELKGLVTFRCVEPWSNQVLSLAGNCQSNCPSKGENHIFNRILHICSF